MKSISYYLKHRNMLFNVIMAKYMGWLPDRILLEIKFRHSMGYKLNLIGPKTYNEKLQWIKLYDRRPEYTIMVDKIKVKEYVASVIGEQYIIPTLGIWDDPANIDFNALPERFVLKVNHTSGTGMYICKDKSKMNVEKVKKDLRRGLKENYYKKYREWPYKNVQPKVFAEAYMEDEFGELRDYKFFCFDGKVKAMFIASDRQKEGEEVKFDFYDTDFNHLPFTQRHPNANVQPSKPKNFHEMIRLAAILSKGIPEVRVDFYNVKGHIYFGEFTFFHFGGMVKFNPFEWDYKFGEWITLSKK